jgi:hypothetical protein
MFTFVGKATDEQRCNLMQDVNDLASSLPFVTSVLPWHFGLTRWMELRSKKAEMIETHKLKFESTPSPVITPTHC